MIEARGVCFAYDGQPVLRDVDLAVDTAELVGVVGANGAGKSTLLRLLGGLLTPDAGSVELFSQPAHAHPRRELARRLAYLPQSYELSFPFTVADVVLMGRYPHGGRLSLETEADLSAAHSAMDRCDVAHLGERRWSQISGGERRRALLAQALCQRTEVVLLDEPTASLDPAHGIAVFEALAAEVDAGLAAIVVTHDLNLCARYCSRVIVIDGARVAAEGRPREVLSAAATARAFGVPMHVGELPGTNMPFVVPGR